MTEEPMSQNTAITHFQQQVAPLSEACAKSEGFLNTVGAMLGDLYTQADAAGDEKAVNMIVVAWQNTQSLAGMIPAFSAALASGGAAVETLHQQRNEIAQELESLMQALDGFDVDDPRLRDFVEIVEEGVAENMMLYYMDDAYETAYEAADQEFHETLMDIFTTSHWAIGQFTPEQHALLQQTLDSFQPEHLK